MDTVIVFDFDLTITDCDSDPWVMEQLGATQRFDSLLPTLPWNTLMDKMMGELHDQGKTISDIEASLRTIPLYPETIRAIKFAFSMGCDLRIVSDANLFFIKTILETHDLLHYFTEIKTNPAFVEESGRLRICPFHPFTGDPHGCNLCPPNMCKGAIIDEMRSSIEDGWNKRFIYLGDGSGDFCPTLKLNERDSVLPRKEYPLWKLVQRNPDMVKAEVHEWSDAKDVEDLFLKLLKPAEMDMVNSDVDEWSDPKDVEDLLMKMLKPAEMDMVNGEDHEWSNPKDVEDLFVKLLKPAEMDMVEDEVHEWADAKDGEDLFVKLLKPAEMDIAKGEVQEWSDIKDVEDLFVKLLKPSQTDYCL